MALTIAELLAKANIKIEDTQIAALETQFSEAYTADVNKQKSGVERKNQELLDKLAKAKEKAIPDGFDIDGYKDYVENKDKIEEEKRLAEEKRLEETQNWQKLKNDMTNNYEQTINQVKNENKQTITSLRSALDSELIENIAIKAIAKEKGSPTLLMPHIKSRIATYQDDNGRFTTKVVDEFGKDAMNTKTGEPMTVSDLVNEFKSKEDFAGAFPTQNKGSNTVVNVDGKNYNAANNPFDKKGNNFSLTEQGKLNRTNPSLAAALKAKVNG